MEICEKLYKIAREKKCTFNLYINPDSSYRSCFIQKDGFILDYWTDESHGDNFTVGGKQCKSFDEAVMTFQKMLLYKGKRKMTQRIFDIYNVKDMKEFWAIIPEAIDRVKKDSISDKNIPYNAYFGKDICWGGSPLIAINWHDKIEITRPIQEATESDIGKLCKFWDDDERYTIGVLSKIDNGKHDNYLMSYAGCWEHCRRLTKAEIEELC